MNPVPNVTATQRPGPPTARPDFRRSNSQLRVWTPEFDSDRIGAGRLGEIEERIKVAAESLRSMRCLIDRLGAIPMEPADESLEREIRAAEERA